jgi:hypothetical protein
MSIWTKEILSDKEAGPFFGILIILLFFGGCVYSCIEQGRYNMQKSGTEIRQPRMDISPQGQQFLEQLPPSHFRK